jgi:DegV family protein with EDD domain
MKEYQIFSDSSCDIPPGLVKESNIRLIPFYVTFDKENYYKENSEISNEEFYNRLIKGGIFPKTSLPSVHDYMDSFEESIKEGKDVMCICLTEKFSGSYQSAVNAKAILEEKYTDAKIIIIDSIQATAGQGLVVLQAAKMQRAGYSIYDNQKRLDEIKNTARIMFTVDTLEYLAKGGRIGKATSLAGTMLNLKPMIQLKDKELIPYTNIRGRKKALKKIIFMVKEYFKESEEDYMDYDFCLANATTMEETLKVGKNTEELIGMEIQYPVFQIGVTIGTYTGPGAVGVCFIKKFDSR